MENADILSPLFKGRNQIDFHHITAPVAISILDYVIEKIPFNQSLLVIVGRGLHSEGDPVLFDACTTFIATKYGRDRIQFDEAHKGGAFRITPLRNNLATVSLPLNDWPPFDPFEHQEHSSINGNDEFPEQMKPPAGYKVETDILPPNSAIPTLNTKECASDLKKGLTPGKSAGTHPAPDSYAARARKFLPIPSGQSVPVLVTKVRDSHIEQTMISDANKDLQDNNPNPWIEVSKKRK